MGKIITSLATLGPLGYAPAPGTIGTLVALPLACAISFLSIFWQVAVIGLMITLSCFIVHHALSYFKQKDPSQIILDEVVGCLVTFFAISYSVQTWMFGFVLFRFFDIFKPCGIAQIEKLPGVWGVVFDDLLAGLFANLIVRWWFA